MGRNKAADCKTQHQWTCIFYPPTMFQGCSPELTSAETRCVAMWRLGHRYCLSIGDSQGTLATLGPLGTSCRSGFPLKPKLPTGNSPMNCQETVPKVWVGDSHKGTSGKKGNSSGESNTWWLSFWLPFTTTRKQGTLKENPPLSRPGCHNGIGPDMSTPIWFLYFLDTLVGWLPSETKRKPSMFLGYPQKRHLGLGTVLFTTLSTSHPSSEISRQR